MAPVSKSLRRGRLHHTHILETRDLMAFCGPCSAMLNENPVGILLRRDEHGNQLLCAPCRRRIYSANDSVRLGLTSFNFVNPAAVDNAAAHASLSVVTSAETVKSLESTMNRWVCPRCSSVIFATPRMFEGEQEPEDWWWCKACQREHKMPAQSVATTCTHNKQSKAAKLDTAVKYPKLDRWFMR